MGSYRDPSAKHFPHALELETLARRIGDAPKAQPVVVLTIDVGLAGGLALAGKETPSGAVQVCRSTDAPREKLVEPVGDTHAVDLFFLVRNLLGLQQIVVVWTIADHGRLAWGHHILVVTSEPVGRHIGSALVVGHDEIAGSQVGYFREFNIFGHGGHEG